MNKVSSKSGAYEIPLTKAAKTIPVATAHPANGNTENPKAKAFDAFMNNKKNYHIKSKIIFKKELKTSLLNLNGNNSTGNL